MKVTAGKFKGRNIESRSERSVRPTSSMVREAVFNLLKHGKFLKSENFKADKNPSVVEDRRIVDIFCGSGALGIEALSRGAAHATLIDQNPKTLAVARQNIEKLGISENVTLIRSDSTSLPKCRQPCKLAFIDPPYRSGLSIPSLLSLKKNNWLEDGALIVIEQSKKESLTPPEGFTLVDERVYNITRISLLQYSD